MAVKTKVQMGFADDGVVRAWLLAEDQKLFTDGLTLPQAMARFKREMSLKVSKERLSNLRQIHCQYWGKEKRIAFTKIPSLREEDWDAIRRWAGKNMDILASAPSLEFVCRLMRLVEIPASPTILQNSVSFMEKWKAARA